MRSDFKVVSAPVHPALTGKTVLCAFTAVESYQLANVLVQSVLDSNDFAGWRWDGTHTASDGIPAPIIPDRHFETLTIPGTTQVTEAKSDPAVQEIAEGAGAGNVTLLVDFQINPEGFQFYKVTRQQSCFTNKVGSSAKGDITYKPHPFKVRIKPGHLF